MASHQLSAQAGAVTGSSRVDPHYPWQVLHEGYTVLVSTRDGGINGIGREGLFDFDTRILSGHRLTVDGVVPDYLSGGAVDSCRWEGHLAVRRSGGTPEGPVLPQDSLEITLTRRVGCGMAERITVTNHSMIPWEGTLTLELDADFADAMAPDESEPKLRLTREIAGPPEPALLIMADGENNRRTFRRALRVRIVGPDPELSTEPVPACSFFLRLTPGGVWSVRLVYGSLVDGSWREPPPESPGLGTPRDRLRHDWDVRRTRLLGADYRLTAAFERSARDLLALRAWEYDEEPDAWFPNAGVPSYTGILGRDILTAGWQAALLGPELMRGALACLARYQAEGDSAWRDEAPGKLPHEIRRGPRAELELIPHRAYYGEQTAPSMFVVVLSEYWHWTGDTAALRRFRPVLERIFGWIARDGDRDGDGLLEYDRRSPKGLKNQGWKDSDEAIRYPDGTIVPDPIATLEEQAFHFLALQRMAEILIALEDDPAAEQYLAQATRLAEQINRQFWLPDRQFYAMGVDSRKEPIASIASNPCHALAAGLVPEGRARQVADRLLSEELFSGWGVRTLSREHPSFNPLAYHLGAVWPVENATFALGLKRYGLDEAVERLVSAQLDAAAQFEDYRLPEALSGHSRSDQALPAPYPGANSPQAWSASAIVLMVQSLLGLFAFAPGHLLTLIRPRLPAWLPWIELRGLRIGAAVVSLRFERNPDGAAAVHILEKTGTLHVVTAPPPRDLEPGRESWLDRVKGWGLEHLPGRTMRALRIAVGRELE